MSVVEGSGDFDRRKHRARRNWLRSDVEHLPGNRHVGIDFYCPRCEVVRFRPRRSQFAGEMWVQRKPGDQIEELDDHEVVHIRCSSTGCETTHFQIKAAKIEQALAEMAKRHAGVHVVSIPLE